MFHINILYKVHLLINNYSLAFTPTEMISFSQLNVEFK